MSTPRPGPRRAPARRRPAWPALAAATLALGAPLLAQDDAADEELPDLGPILEALEDLRGLEFLREVPAEVQSLEDFGAFVDKSLEEEMPVARRDGIMRGLVRLGLLAEPIDLAGSFRDALLSQAGAYYDPVSGTFYYLMTGMPAILMDTIAAHELVHAQQDQHFDLGAITAALTPDDPDVPRPDDAILAMRFLVEGDATLTMTLHQFSALGGKPDIDDVRPMIKLQAEMTLDQLVANSQMAVGMLGEDSPMAKAMTAMDDIPPYILRPLMAAYLQGAWFCLETVEHGGWEALDGAYTDLPTSSEQVLHPERYLGETRDEPTPVTLPAFAALGEGFTRLDSAVHGEHYLRILLDNLGVAADIVEHATDGWDGDLYQAWDTPEGGTLIVLATTWDSPMDAYEFQEAYVEALHGKYPGFAPASDDLAVPDLRYACGEGLGHGALVLRGREVFVVEGGTRAVVAALVEELGALSLEHVP